MSSNIHSVVSYQELAERPVVISEQQRDWIQLLATLTQTQDTAVAAEGGPVRGSGSMAPSPQDCSLGWAGQALIGVADGKWSEARDAADKSMLCSAMDKFFRVFKKRVLPLLFL